MNPVALNPSRRQVLAGLASLAALGAAGCTTISPTPPPAPEPAFPQEALLMYRAMPEEDFPIPAVDLTRLDPIHYRQPVAYPTPEPPGTIIVDTGARFLYLIEPGGMATRYGVGIGREGFAWAGRASIAYKRRWPTWTPPAEMIARQPELAKWKNGQPPGLDNPLGARALYIFQDGRDTLYRLHGSGEVATIGHAVSSGCVRLLHQDIIDLHDRVEPGATIIVI